MKKTLITGLLVTSTIFGCDKQCGHLEVQDFNIQKTENRQRFIVNYTLNESTKSSLRITRLGRQETWRINYAEQTVQDTLVGFAQGSTYQVEIVSGECVIDSDTIVTGDRVVGVLRDIQLITDTGDFNGQLMFHQELNKLRHLYAIINEKGEVLWYHILDGAPGAFSWTDDNHLLAILSRKDIVEIDLKGNVLNEFVQGDGVLDFNPHHEIAKDSIGNIYTLVYDTLRLDVDLSARYGTDKLVADGVFTIMSDVMSTWKWSTLDVEFPEIDNYLDWGHANSLVKTDDGYLISYKNFNQVWKVRDGKVIWKHGEDGDFDMASNSIYSGQHAAYMDNGEMILFDNGTLQTGSRALVFELDERNMKSTLREAYALPPRLHSGRRGNAIRHGDYMIVNSTMTNTIVALNSEGEIIWELKLAKPSYRVEIKNSMHN